jgi:hypothetical protein
MLRAPPAPVAASVCLLSACGDSPPARDLRCGPGTHEVQLQCVPESGLSCAPGTYADGGVCRLDTDRVTCGGGTHLANGCLPDSVLSCGSGTPRGWVG